MVSDKSPCARELLTPLRRQSPAVNNKHRAIYLYPARARRFVRRGSLRGRAMALSRSLGQAAAGETQFCTVATPLWCLDSPGEPDFSDISDAGAVRNVREISHPHSRNRTPGIW